MLLTPMSQDTEHILKLREVLARPPRERETPPVEVGRLLSIWMEREPISDIASKIGLRDVGTLRQFIRLTTLPADVQERVTWGRQSGELSFTVASEIARARSPAEQRHLAELALQHGWSKKDVQRALRDRTGASP